MLTDHKCLSCQCLSILFVSPMLGSLWSRTTESFKLSWRLQGVLIPPWLPSMCVLWAWIHRLTAASSWICWRSTASMSCWLSTIHAARKAREISLSISLFIYVSLITNALSGSASLAWLENTAWLPPFLSFVSLFFLARVSQEPVLTPGLTAGAKWYCLFRLWYTAAFTPLTSVCLCMSVCLCVCFLSILTATCGFLPQLRLRSRPEKWQNWSLCLFVTACFVDLNCDSFLLASAVLETWCNGPVWVSSVLHLSPTDIT